MTIYHWIAATMIGGLVLADLVLIACQVYGWWEMRRDDRRYTKYLRRHGR